MARANEFNLELQLRENLTSTVAFGCLPKPVIIDTGMDLCDWKKRFLQLQNNATIPYEKSIYNRCFKALLWAEFCNGTIIYAGNSKDEDGNLMIKFTFKFPDLDCMELFKDDFLEKLEIVTSYPAASISHD